VGQLARARTFVEAARLVCDQAKLIGAQPCAIVLDSAAGPAALGVDNFEGMPDEDREHIVTQPSLSTFVRRYGDQRPNGDVFATPIVGASGSCATFGCALPLGYPIQMERDLAMMSTYFSVWCTQHGIAPVPRAIDDEQLAPRQHRIADLAARGYTNGEIADTLHISINTVKSRLQETFDRLSVHNRTELANVLRQLAPLQGVPRGITRYKTVTLTRAADTRLDRRPRSRRPRSRSPAR
jgi:DNA-binding CsgD family transcriptional regulator